MKILQMRLAPLPVVLGLVLLVPVVVQGQPAPTSRTQIVVQGQPAPTTQNSRAAAIATEQAEKAKALQPYTPSAVERKTRVAQTRVPRAAERLLSVLRQRLLRRRLYARGRVPAVLRRPDPRRREGSLFDLGLQADRGQHRFVGARRRAGRSARPRRAGATRRRWRSTAWAWTVPRTAPTTE